MLKPIDFKFDVMSFINPCIKMPNLQLNSQNVAKLICFAIIYGGYLFMKGSVYILPYITNRDNALKASYTSSHLMTLTFNL